MNHIGANILRLFFHWSPPSIPGAPNPPGKNRVTVEFAHGPHNLYLSIAVEIVLQGN